MLLTPEGRVAYKPTLPINYHEKEAGIFKKRASKYYPLPTAHFLENIFYAGRPPLREATPESHLNEDFQGALDEAVLLGNFFCERYYHWLIECLPQLLFLQEEDLVSTVLIPDDAHAPFIRSSLALLGVEAICCVKPPHFVTINTLIRPVSFSNDSLPNPLYLQKLREQLVGKGRKAWQPGEQALGERFYIKRVDSKKRKLLNETALIERLHRYGFEIISPEELRFEDTLNRFKKAQFIVGQHGGGLSNMLFMPQGSKVLEIGMKECYPLHYFHLASVLKHRYFYFLEVEVAAGGEGYLNRFPHDLDFTVDLDKFEIALEEML